MQPLYEIKCLYNMLYRKYNKTHTGMFQLHKFGSWSYIATLPWNIFLRSYPGERVRKKKSEQ